MLYVVKSGNNYPKSTREAILFITDEIEEAEEYAQKCADPTYLYQCLTVDFETGNMKGAKQIAQFDGPCPAEVELKVRFFYHPDQFNSDYKKKLMQLKQSLVFASGVENVEIKGLTSHES